MSADTARPSLSLYVFGFVLVSGVLAGAAALFFGERQMRAFDQEVLRDAVVTRASTMAMIVARALYADWRDVQSLAEEVPRVSTAAIRARLDQISSLDERVSWAGYAPLDGVVTAASGGVLEGVSVAERPWFRRGLEGPYAGDPHEAVLLARLMPEGDQPVRFIDLASPVKDAAGRVIGVLGIHINTAWAEAYIAETGIALDIEANIVRRDGAPVLGAADRLPASFDVAGLRAAMVGAGGAALERWPDGVEAMTVVVPDVAYGDLPPLGWSLIARVDSKAFASARARLSTDAWVLLALVGLAILAATYLFHRLLLRPIGRLAETAAEIADGADIYPYETRRTREGALLSDALARLQVQAVMSAAVPDDEPDPPA